MRRVRNPLTAFMRDTDRSPSSVARPLRPLMTPRAPQFYMEELKAVPFNFRLLLVDQRESQSEDEEDDILSPREVAEDLCMSTGEHVVVLSVDVGFLASGAEKPGDPYRVSPFTPFTILHRMYDSLMDGSGGPPLDSVLSPECPVTSVQMRNLQFQVDVRVRDAVDDMIDPRFARDQAIKEKCARRLTSAGVATAAGRLSAFNSMDQVSADIFALKAKTGRWGFVPEVIPDMQGLPVTSQTLPGYLVSARRQYNAGARQFIYGLIEGLRRAAPQVFVL